MKQVFRFDNNGFYVEPVVIQDNESNPADCTEVKPEDGLYKAQFVDGQWIEGATQAEIDAIKNTPQPLTDIEQIKKQQTDLIFQLMLGGVI